MKHQTLLLSLLHVPAGHLSLKVPFGDVHVDEDLLRARLEGLLHRAHVAVLLLLVGALPVRGGELQVVARGAPHVEPDAVDVDAHPRVGAQGERAP